jgi:hypothetical protein
MTSGAALTAGAGRPELRRTRAAELDEGNRPARTLAPDGEGCLDHVLLRSRVVGSGNPAGWYLQEGSDADEDATAHRTFRLLLEADGRPGKPSRRQRYGGPRRRAASRVGVDAGGERPSDATELVVASADEYAVGAVGEGPRADRARADSDEGRRAETPPIEGRSNDDVEIANTGERRHEPAHQRAIDNARGRAMPKLRGHGGAEDEHCTTGPQRSPHRHHENGSQGQEDNRADGK